MTCGSTSASATVSQIEPVHTPWAPSAMRRGHLAAAADAAGGEHRHVRADGVDHLGHQHHRGDLAAVAAGLGALGDDDVDADARPASARGARSRPAPPTNTPGACACSIDVRGRRAERVDQQAYRLVRQRHLDLRPDPRLGPRRGRPPSCFRNRPAAAAAPRAPCRIFSTNSRWPAGIIASSCAEAGRLAASLSDVLRGHREVDAVGLAADVGVDPVELDLELVGDRRPARPARRSRRPC